MDGGCLPSSRRQPGDIPTKNIFPLHRGNVNRAADRGSHCNYGRTPPKGGTPTCHRRACSALVYRLQPAPETDIMSIITMAGTEGFGRGLSLLRPMAGRLCRTRRLTGGSAGRSPRIKPGQPRLQRGKTPRAPFLVAQFSGFPDQPGGSTASVPCGAFEISRLYTSSSTLQRFLNARAIARLTVRLGAWDILPITGHGPSNAVRLKRKNHEAFVDSG